MYVIGGVIHRPEKKNIYNPIQVYSLENFEKGKYDPTQVISDMGFKLRKYHSSCLHKNSIFVSGGVPFLFSSQKKINTYKISDNSI
jgi:hypothetical protein